MTSRGERNIAWIAEFCCVPEGKDVGKPVKLRDWQKDIIRSIYDTPTRRAIISFGRKNGKTALAACLLLLHLCGPEAVRNGQLFSSAMAREQAALLYKLSKQMVLQSPALKAVVEVREAAKQLACPSLGTSYRSSATPSR